MDLLFLTAYVAFPVLLVLLMRLFGLPLGRFSILGLLLITIFIFDYFGTLPLYFAWIEYRYLTGVQDKYLIFIILCLTSWTMLGLVFGFVGAGSVFGRLSDGFYRQPIRPLHEAEGKASLFLLLVCVVALGLYLYHVPKTAIWAALTQGLPAAKLARSAMTNDFPGKYHWYKVMMSDMMMVILFTLYAHWQLKRSRSAFNWFCITLGVSAFVAIMATEKAPIVFLLIGLFLTNVIVRHQGKYPIGRGLVFGIFSLAVLIMFYLKFMGSGNAEAAFAAVLSRAFTGQISPAYYYLEYFPAHHDFLWGASFPNLHGLLPHTPYNLPVEIMNWKFPDVEQSGVVGSAPTIFWGEMYANFGYLGAIIAPFFVGIGLYIVSALLERFENTPLKVGLVVWIALHYKDLAITGLSNFTEDFYLVVVVMLWLLAVLAANMGKLRLYRPHLKDDL